TGKVAELALDEVGLTTNKNTIPYDKESPFVTSGIRTGTSAATSRGFDEDAFKEVASIIAKVLKNIDDEAVKKEAKERVKALTDKLPVYNDVCVFFCKKIVELYRNAWTLAGSMRFSFC